MTSMARSDFGQPRSVVRTRSAGSPYLKSKELIGGLYVIEAGSRDAAIEWAKDASRAVGMPIEVRPFLDFRAES